MNKTQTINLSIPKSLLEKVDALAEAEGSNRSELIRQAARSYLRTKDVWDELFKYGQETGQKLGIKSEEDVNNIVYEFRHGRKSS